MVLLPDVLDGVAQAMEDGVSELTTALPREQDKTDNDVVFPFGEINVIANPQLWTERLGTTEDENGNEVGYLIESRFEAELQLNIWVAVPSDQHDEQELGKKMEKYFRKFLDARGQPAPLPDGSGGTLDDVNPLDYVSGGELPTQQNNNPPWRGYQVTLQVPYIDRIDTAEEWGELDYIEEIDIPDDGTSTDTDGNVMVEYSFTV